jgi:hypothetical protein
MGKRNSKMREEGGRSIRPLTPNSGGTEPQTTGRMLKLENEECRIETY